MTLPTLTSPFMCRKDELEQLRSSLSDQQENPQLIDVAITGLPRIGKTQLLLKYIKDNERKYNNIIWLSGKCTEDLTTQLIEVAKLTKTLNNDYKINSNTDIKFIISKLYRTLNKSQTLLVFDGVLIDILPYLPPIGVKRNNIVIIITSQFTEWQCNKHIHIKGITSESAEQYLIQNLENCNVTNAKILAKKCEYMPSIIKLLISFYKANISNDREYNVEKLVEFISTTHGITDIINDDNLDIEIINLQKSCNGIIGSLLKFHICEISLRALKLLEFMAYLVHDEIEVDLFTSVKRNKSKYKVHQAILLLQSYSLINVHNKKIVISPIIQKIIRLTCDTDEIVKSILKCFSCKVDQTNFSYVPFIPYIFKCHLMKIYNEYATPEIKKEFYMVFLSASARGDPKELIESHTKVYRYFQEVLGDSVNMVFHCYYVDAINGVKAYDIIIAITNELITKYGIKHLESDFHGAMILYFRSHALFKLGIYQNLEEAWELCLGAFDKIRNVVLERAGYKALQLLGKIAYKLTEQDSNEEKFNIFVDIIYYVYTNLFKYKSKSLLFAITKELEPISIVIQYYIQSNRAQKALEFILELYNELKEELLIGIEKDLVGDHSDVVHKYLRYKHSECLFALNDIDDAWKILHEVFEDESSYMLDHKHEMLLLYCKLAHKIGTNKAINSCYKQLNAYIEDKSFINIDGVVKCYEILEPIYCAKGKYGKILKFYNEMEQDYERDQYILSNYSIELNVCKIKIYKAISICKYIVNNNAWEIYGNVCNFMKHTIEIEPDCIDDKLKLFKNIIQELDLALKAV